MRPWAIKFYHSKAWLDCRAAYIASRIGIDGGLCEHCRKAHGYIVHHTRWLTEQTINDPAIALNHANLEYVCQACHNDEHLGTRVQPRYRVDAYGRILPPV